MRTRSILRLMAIVLFCAVLHAQKVDSRIPPVDASVNASVNASTSVNANVVGIPQLSLDAPQPSPSTTTKPSEASTWGPQKPSASTHQQRLNSNRLRNATDDSQLATRDADAFVTNSSSNGSSAGNANSGAPGIRNAFVTNSSSNGSLPGNASSGATGTSLSSSISRAMSQEVLAQAVKSAGTSTPSPGIGLHPGGGAKPFQHPRQHVLLHNSAGRKARSQAATSDPCADFYQSTLADKTKPCRDKANNASASAGQSLYQNNAGVSTGQPLYPAGGLQSRDSAKR